ncbi:hypothetical protein BJ944DRAFT_233246 [Cunninghamella echinulata]|nr:hypothetical protein BJ944DRAFT_233246 [Cunninghamella echinulata]
MSIKQYVSKAKASIMFHYFFNYRFLEKYIIAKHDDTVKYRQRVEENMIDLRRVVMVKYNAISVEECLKGEYEENEQKEMAVQFRYKVVHYPDEWTQTYNARHHLNGEMDPWGATSKSLETAMLRSVSIESRFFLEPWYERPAFPLLTDNDNTYLKGDNILMRRSDWYTGNQTPQEYYDQKLVNWIEYRGNCSSRNFTLTHPNYMEVTIGSLWPKIKIKNSCELNALLTLAYLDNSYRQKHQLSSRLTYAAVSVGVSSIMLLIIGVRQWLRLFILDKQPSGIWHEYIFRWWRSFTYDKTVRMDEPSYPMYGKGQIIPWPGCNWSGRKDVVHIYDAIKGQMREVVFGGKKGTVFICAKESIPLHIAAISHQWSDGIFSSSGCSDQTRQLLRDHQHKYALDGYWLDACAFAEVGIHKKFGLSVMGSIYRIASHVLIIVRPGNLDAWMTRLWCVQERYNATVIMVSDGLSPAQVQDKTSFMDVNIDRYNIVHTCQQLLKKKCYRTSDHGYILWALVGEPESSEKNEFFASFSYIGAWLVVAILIGFFSWNDITFWFACIPSFVIMYIGDILLKVARNPIVFSRGTLADILPKLSQVSSGVLLNSSARRSEKYCCWAPEEATLEDLAFGVNMRVSEIGLEYEPAAFSVPGGRCDRNYQRVDQVRIIMLFKEKSVHREK